MYVLFLQLLQCRRLALVPRVFRLMTYLSNVEKRVPCRRNHAQIRRLISSVLTTSFKAT